MWSGSSTYRARRVQRALRPLRPLRGFTLVELLVVITIIVVVTASAIPIVSPAIANRRLREGSRVINSFISGARSRALSTGRPVGIRIERFPVDRSTPPARFSMNLSYVEVPPPLSGDTASSRASVAQGLPFAMVTHLGGAGSWTDATLEGQVRSRDRIRFDYQGRWYWVFGGITQPDGTLVVPELNNPSTHWFVEAVDGSGMQPVVSAAGVPYQVIRQPRKAAGTPLQLPDGVVIDLRWSGKGGNWVFDDGPPVGVAKGNPIILFMPGGRVDRIYDGSEPVSVDGPIHLLIGRRDGADQVAELDNLEDQTNIWVSIHHRTGQITSSENVGVSGPLSPLANARSIAQSAQGMGGR